MRPPDIHTLQLSCPNHRGPCGPCIYPAGPWPAGPHSCRALVSCLGAGHRGVAPNTLFGSNDKHPRGDQYSVTGLVWVAALQGVHVARATRHDNERTHTMRYMGQPRPQRGVSPHAVLFSWYSLFWVWVLEKDFSIDSQMVITRVVMCLFYLIVFPSTQMKDKLC